MLLQKHKILLCITGSIAAYKSLILCRLLVKAGAEVRVIMTQSARDFIQPLSFATLSKNDVVTSFYTASENWHNHVELGLWADLIVIAPCTANTMAKMANGICDSVLLATYLSARCKILVAPAMDVDMYHHPSTQRNIRQLEQDNVTILPTGDGSLASGLEGKGRMLEPEEIMAYIERHTTTTDSKFLEKNIVISAGPTREHIDPVRFISNPSTGSMGIALANDAAMRGANVTLVLGPVTGHRSIHPTVKVVSIITAEDMYNEMTQRNNNADIMVMTAAVADYTPASTSSHKMKKKEGDLSIELQRTKDILQTLGNQKTKQQILVGFALETQNGVTNATKKLVKKNLDIIVLNEMNKKGIGFGNFTNQITIIDANNNQTNFELKNKEEVASDILAYISKHYL